MSQFDAIPISRAPRDKEHPYLMVCNDLIRDDRLRPECRMLIIYLLSHADQWEITTTQVMRHFKAHMGRDKILSLFNEGIEAGYIKRIEYLENGKKRYRYLVDEQAKFKKCLLCPGFQYTEFQSTENSTTLRSTLKKNNLKKESSITQSEPPKPEPKKEKASNSLMSDLIEEISCTQEEFKIAYEKYQASTNKITNLKKWLRAVILQDRLRRKQEELAIIEMQKVEEESMEESLAKIVRMVEGIPDGTEDRASTSSMLEKKPRPI